MIDSFTPQLAGWLIAEEVFAIALELEALNLPPQSSKALLRRKLEEIKAHRRRRWLEEWLV